MTDKIGNSLLDLQQQMSLLQKEYEYEKEEYQQQTRQAGIARRVQQGVCWFPVQTGTSRYNSLNQLTVEISRSLPDDTESLFEYGRPVCFFRVAADGTLRYFNFRLLSVMCRTVGWLSSCLAPRRWQNWERRVNWESSCILTILPIKRCLQPCMK